MSTPGFYHKSVLLEESIDALQIKPDGIYIDCTFGGGGHSRAILSKLGPSGRLICFDQDEDAWQNRIEDSRVLFIRENFRYLQRFLKLHKVPPVDGILADLGVSSHQFDTAERGFSIRFDAALDMRMDLRSDLTAQTIITTYSEQQLHRLFEQYGEVTNSRTLARHIVQHRHNTTLRTVDELKRLLDPIMKGNPNRYLAQVFQALRIEVNDEMGVLKEMLEQTTACLNPGGRLAIITFHSLEDRLVKQFMKQGTLTPEEEHPLLSTHREPVFKVLTKKPIEASETELKENPRSRSARLRVAEKL